MSKIDWTKKQRQAPIGLLLFAANTLRAILKAAWPLLLIFLFKENTTDRTFLYLWLSIGGAIFMLIHTVLTYWFFKFRIIGNEFVVNKGYLKKIKLSVALDRIQTVNIKQNIFQRILGVVTVEIDTAGAKDAEIKLIAIKEEFAADFEETFGQSSPTKANDESVESAKEKPFIVNEDNLLKTESYSNSKTPIVGLSVVDLLKVGISENHLKNLLAIVGLVYGLYYQLGDIFQKRIEEFAAKGVDNIENLSLSAFVYLGIFLLIFAIGISMIKTILRFYNLTMTQVKEKYVISYGLLNTKIVNIPVNKIQLIIWESNPLRNILKFKTLSIKQASADNQVKKDQNINIPACNSSQQKHIENSLFGNKEIDFSEKIKTQPFYFIRQFVFILIIFIAIEIVFWFYKTEFMLPAILLLITASVGIFIKFKKRSFRISDTVIEINKGLIGSTTKLMQNYKIQSVSFNQSFFMKRRKLATIIIYTAAGNILRIPYVKENIATDLADFLLYKIESSDMSWM